VKYWQGKTLKNKLMGLVALACVLSTPAMAGENILRGPAPNWLPAIAPHLSNLPDNSSQHVRYEVVENHSRAFGTHTETYVRMRMRVLSPLGLQQASQLGLVWNPGLQTPTVHHARLIRAGQTSDILDKADFTILRREAALEQSLQINGLLTGVLVNPDIRVGDTIDFAYSLRTQFDVFNNPLEALAFPYSPLPVDLAVTTFSWPASMSVETRAGSHTAVPPITRQGDFNVLMNRMTDVEAQTYPDDLATRYLPDYGWQISNIPTWGTIADQVRPAYDQASVLPEAADMAAHVERIRSEHATPEARALAALRLVQDEVRYMALTLGEGGWLPVSANDVWASRQGDCKGKTVLLVALLRALGIDAVPALVSSSNLPLDKFLPMVGAFDHVIVKARINGETYLMDGARIGDRSLTPDVPLVHEYALPIIDRADLEQISLRLPPRPAGALHVEFDFSDGIYSPARVRLTDIDRGHAATEMQAGVGQVPATELTRLYDERWTELLEEFGALTDLQSQWEYRESTHEFVASATARVAFNWSEGPVNIPLAHVTWKGVDLRAAERFEDADYARGFPGSSSFRTTVILPEGEDVVDLSVQRYEVEAGATRYYRTIERNGNRLETDRGSIVLRPYATAAEIRAEQAGMDRFKDLTATMQVMRSYTLTPTDRQTLTTATASDPEVALRRGYALNNEGDHVGAIAQFDLALTGFTSPHANALANRALAYLALNDLEKARADIAAGEAVDPNDTILLHAKGRLAEIEGDDLDAVLAFTGALRSWPENTHALYRRAAAYERMGQSVRALADLERVVTLQPQDNSSKNELASLLLRMGRAEQAYEQIGLMAQAIGYPDAKAPLFIDMAQSLASSLKGTDPAKAEAVLTNALAVETDVPALLIDRASIREMQGDSGGAAEDIARFRQMTSISLDDPAEACISQTLARHSRNAALALCDSAIERDANNAELHMRRGYLLYTLSRGSEAVTAYRTATKLDPVNQKAKYGLGEVLTSAGQIAEGEALMAAALSADPTANEDYDAPLLEVIGSD
jgi:tetratricopeptide (TPR) repeat protein